MAEISTSFGHEQQDNISYYILIYVLESSYTESFELLMTCHALLNSWSYPYSPFGLHRLSSSPLGFLAVSCL